MYMYTPVPLAGELYEQAKAEGFQFPETLEEWINPDWQEFSQRRSVDHALAAGPDPPPDQRLPVGAQRLLPDKPPTPAMSSAQAQHAAGVVSLALPTGRLRATRWSCARCTR